MQFNGGDTMGMGMAGVNPMGMGGMNPGMGGMNPGMGGMNPGMGMGGMNPGMGMGGMNPGMGMGGMNPGMGMGGMNPGMGMGGMNPGMGMGGMNPFMGMGGMNPLMGMGGVGFVGIVPTQFPLGTNIVIEDQQGWNLIFENQNDKKSYSIRISEQKTVQEAINLYLLKSGRSPNCKFIFNNKPLYPEMIICQSGLQNLSKILVISLQNVIGAN